MKMIDYPETPENNLDAKVAAAFTLDNQEILRSFNRESYSKTLVDCRDVYFALVQSGATEQAEYFYRIASDCLGDIFQLNSFVEEDRRFMQLHS